ncbi:MAG TPA: chromosome partitioning protein ParB, partial [Pirellulales bacterium]|nr:chromosome partitioning protein ParB [Pirellulales bacterium]
RALLSLGDEREQVSLCRKIQEDGLSVRAVESIVQHTVSQSEREELGIDDDPATVPARRPTRKPAGELTVLEQELRSALGTKVEIRTGAKGRGKIIVHFTSHDEFDRLREHLHGSHSRSRKAG